MNSHPTRQPRDEDAPAEMIAEEERAAEDGLLLEFPLQERHHRIISTFMADMAEPQRNPSRDGPGTSTNRLPVPGVLQKLALRLKTWWGQRAQRKAPP